MLVRVMYFSVFLPIVLCFLREKSIVPMEVVRFFAPHFLLLLLATGFLLQGLISVHVIIRKGWRLSAWDILIGMSHACLCLPSAIPRKTDCLAKIDVERTDFENLCFVLKSGLRYCVRHKQAGES